MRVELVMIGDELLIGDTVNGNAAWLGRQLTDSGIDVARSVVVGDDEAVIGEAVTAALARANVVITTGGLGPTPDDLTREALAKAAGVPIVRDAAAADWIRRRMADRGLPLRPMALRMAEHPEGATPLANPMGTALAFRLELGGGAVYALPGVPGEVRAIFTGSVLPDLLARRDGHIPVRRTLRTALAWESAIATRLVPVEALDDIRLAYLPGIAEVRIRVTATGPDAPARLAHVEQMIRDLLGPVVYGADDETLDQVVHRLLAERSATVATAESLTGGLLGARLTDMPGSSATFRGGVVAYATDLKAGLLDVPRDLLAAHGAVHADVAAAMARGVSERLGATYGLAVTGVAGPDHQDGHSVGTVHLSVAGPGSELSKVSVRLPTPGSGPRVRHWVRDATVTYALDLLRRRLLGLPVDRPWDADSQDREVRG
ncbi:MAG TPA: CinA family nicotinamide mononucleotide deamidase-related protein [Streptosporangiaceae bacterium]|jgi:nicotinamide-nucleotide amidase|nr:CinA family nicotinamide mononucleotide deamidase-related protein [Streptosporangiaceae bacterium]